MGNGINALKKIIKHLEENLEWPSIKVYRGFIGVEENRCEVETNFPSLEAYEKSWQKWGSSPESKNLAEKYHQLVQTEKIEILQIVT
ncbi:MAG: hypothetical protein P8184_16190 [Calditrichia bacterium]